MSDDLFNVSGSVCLVTGASSGLGLIIAEGLVEAGAKVILAARRIERLKQHENSLRAKGFESMAIQCDVTHETEVERAIKSTVSTYGSLDLLVNNAGNTHVSTTTSLSLDDWKKVLDVNLTGAFLCAKHAAKEMIRRGKGKIINIASVYGVMADTSPELPYYTSKAGIIGLTRQLALELAPNNIQVNAIAPGFFESEMTKPIIEDADAVSYSLARIPVKRMGRPDELKGVVRFLASKASDYITGQLIIVDGGWTLW